MNKITVICQETYPDPLIYNVIVVDPQDVAEIREETIKARIQDLGDELEDEIRENMRLLLVFTGWIDWPLHDLRR